MIGADYFDEVGAWLRYHNFLRYYDVCKVKGATMLKDLPEKITRADIKKV